MGILKSLYSDRPKDIVKIETDQAIADFLAKGGAITQVKSRKGKSTFTANGLTANGKNSGNVFFSVYQ